MALCTVSSICACTIFSGSGTSVCSSSVSSALSRICSACWMRLTRSTWSLRLAFSSSMVSNSLASWANSSSGSGSSRSLTELTVTVTCASSPACSPAASVVVKTLVSPSFMPTIASSRPSMSWPEPTSWDRPSVLASGTSLPSTVADRSIETKSPSSAARSTPVSVPKRARSDLQLGVDVLVGHLDRVDLDLQRLEIGNGDVGADVDLGGEDELLAVLDLGDLDLGLAERAHLGARDRLAVAAGQGVVDDLLEHGAAADAGLEQLAPAPCLAGSRAAGPAWRAA